MPAVSLSKPSALIEPVTNVCVPWLSPVPDTCAEILVAWPTSVPLRSTTTVVLRVVKPETLKCSVSAGVPAWSLQSEAVHAIISDAGLSRSAVRPGTTHRISARLVGKETGHVHRTVRSVLDLNRPIIQGVGGCQHHQPCPVRKGVRQGRAEYLDDAPGSDSCDLQVGHGSIPIGCRCPLGNGG